MNCTSCGADLPEDSKFCPKCGNNLSTSGKNGSKQISYDEYIYEELSDCEEHLHSIRFWIRFWSILAFAGVGLTIMIYILSLLAERY